ncbi:MAG: hypothetical protein EAZ52_06545 [Alphaproteobacteria bacterium]|nr:MAG: hypothetical protein EAZ52_06545 [Alphaproteobacteria bacterium]
MLITSIDSQAFSSKNTEVKVKNPSSQKASLVFYVHDEVLASHVLKSRETFVITASIVASLFAQTDELLVYYSLMAGNDCIEKGMINRKPHMRF